jgi:3-oxoacyl-[acyl-carrier protein] reductase
MTSVVGQSGNAAQANYSASKAGLIGLTKSLAKEFASRNIRVNAVAPGFVQTDMTDKLSDQIKEQTLALIPLKRFATTTDIAKAVMFLSSDDGGYITGQILAVNGGLYI